MVGAPARGQPERRSRSWSSPAEHMAHFKALREAEVVEDLPRGGTGKIMKQELKKLYG